MSWQRGGTCGEQEINLQAYLVSLREKGRKLLLAWELLGFVSFGESAGWKKLGEKESRELILSQTKRPGRQVTVELIQIQVCDAKWRTFCAKKDLYLFQPRVAGPSLRPRVKVCFWSLSFLSVCPAQQCWGPLITFRAWEGWSKHNLFKSEMSPLILSMFRLGLTPPAQPLPGCLFQACHPSQGG